MSLTFSFIKFKNQFVEQPNISDKDQACRPKLYNFIS